MDTGIRIAIIDDHPLFRAGVIHILSARPDLDVVGQGASASDAISVARNESPDLLILDVSIPGGGLDALESIVAECPKTKVVMLTVSVDKPDVLKALRLGARGYVVKGVSGTDLVQALLIVAQGDRYISPSLGAMLLSDFDHTKTATRGKAIDDLSHREGEVLSLVTQGLSNKEIGIRLNLSDKTVKHYMTSVFQKLHVRNRLEAALLVRKPVNVPTNDVSRTAENRSPSGN